jgi:phage terminase large subunit-like protein
MDATNLESRPYPKQLDIFSAIKTVPVRAIIAGNQTGKSSVGGREVSWILEDKHPFFKREELWGICPITILVLGQVGEQIESNLWAVKIKPFLMPGTFKEVRIGNALQRVEFKNGDRLIFISHHNCNEARKTVQGYTAHYVWIDEMPTALSLVAELVTRIISKNGRLLITFTPLLRSMEIKQYIEGLKLPIGQVFNVNMLDNPIFAGRETEILAQYSNYPTAEREARLYGRWFTGSNAVYSYNPEAQKVQVPFSYSPLWPHIEAVDPAAASKLGYVLYARDPIRGQWYMVKAKYINGAAPSDLVNLVAIESAGYNVVRRISDPHETWFIKEAWKAHVLYEGVFKKSERKLELIKNLQQALTSGTMLVSESCYEFFEEVIACQWAENEDHIVNGSKYHILDAAQYGLDVLDLFKEEKVRIFATPLEANDVQVREKNKARKEKEMRIRKSQRKGRGILRCLV